MLYVLLFQITCNLITAVFNDENTATGYFAISACV